MHQGTSRNLIPCHQTHPLCSIMMHHLHHFWPTSLPVLTTLQSFLFFPFFCYLWFLKVFMVLFHSFLQAGAGFLLGRPRSCPAPARFWPASWHIFASFSFFSCIQSWFSFLFLSFSFILVGPGSAGFLLGRIGRPSSCRVPAPFLAGILAFLYFFYSFRFSTVFHGFPMFSFLHLPAWRYLELGIEKKRKGK